MLLGIDASQANRRIRSGTEWYAFYLIEEFKKILGGRADIRVRLYLRDALRADLAKNLPANFATKVLRWPLRYFWGQIRLSWEMLLHRPDVLFCPAHTIPLLHPPKTLTTLHDVGFADNPELYDKFSLWYHRFSARLAVREAAHIFTISEFSKKRIVEVYHCAPEKVSVVYHGFDAGRFKPMDEAMVTKALQKYGLHFKDYIYFIGRLEPKKNILGMIRAYELLLSRMPDVPDLVFAGRAVDLKSVEEYLKTRLALKSRIIFLEYVPGEDMATLYAGAKVFLFPTLYEGFGLPIVEAQACGTPVVTSNITSNAEIAGNGAVVVDPRNIQAIAAELFALLTDENLVVQKVTAGFENLKRFSWQKTAQETLSKLL